MDLDMLAAAVRAELNRSADRAPIEGVGADLPKVAHDIAVELAALPRPAGASRRIVIGAIERRRTLHHWSGRQAERAIVRTVGMPMAPFT